LIACAASALAGRHKFGYSLRKEMAFSSNRLRADDAYLGAAIAASKRMSAIIGKGGFCCSPSARFAVEACGDHD
jgi:hypothetical protein